MSGEQPFKKKKKGGGGCLCRDLLGIGVNKTQKRRNQTLRENDLLRDHHRKRHLQ